MDGNLSRRTKGWDHGQRDKWADKWVVERAHGQTDEGTSKPPNNDTLQRLGGRTNGSAEWRRDGQRDGRTDRKITDGCFCMLPNPRLRASCLQLKLYNVWRMSVRYISTARSSSCTGPLAGCTQCLRKRAPRSATLASLGNDCVRPCS